VTFKIRHNQYRRADQYAWGTACRACLHSRQRLILQPYENTKAQYKNQALGIFTLYG